MDARRRRFSAIAATPQTIASASQSHGLSSGDGRGAESAVRAASCGLSAAAGAADAAGGVSPRASGAAVAGPLTTLSAAGDDVVGAAANAGFGDALHGRVATCFPRGRRRATARRRCDAGHEGAREEEEYGRAAREGHERAQRSEPGRCGRETRHEPPRWDRIGEGLDERDGGAQLRDVRAAEGARHEMPFDRGFRRGVERAIDVRRQVGVRVLQRHGPPFL